MGDGVAAERYDVVVVGGGFSGIGAAIALDRAGFGNLLLVEDGDGVGGAWHWNTYPGIGVDIPSFSYQFSFDTRSDWSRVYAPGRELKAYAEDCVDKFRLRDRLRLNTRIVEATFDDHANLWTLRTHSGDDIVTRYVVIATGVLTQPKAPDIPGLDDFAGTIMHTARWDHGVDIRGKRVAIVGTGASAVQVVPTIAPEVDSLVVFQRTPIWCLPKADRAIGAATRQALRIPLVRRASRLVSQAYVELNFPIAAHFAGVVPVTKTGEKIALSFLAKQVSDPAVRAKLTPTYSLGCKRPAFSNDYLRAFNRSNVLLETDPIDSITAGGVRTRSGAEHAVDVLVLATGFKVFEAGNMPPFPVSGAGGLDLEKFWDENRFQAYQGVSVPGFPNIFSILGPYGFNGASYFNLIETQSRHIARCLRRARRVGATRVEVTERAHRRYWERMLKRRPNQVFFHGDCTSANSYYFDKHGDVPFRPSLTVETMLTAATFPLSNYTFS